MIARFVARSLLIMAAMGPAGTGVAQRPGSPAISTDESASTAKLEQQFAATVKPFVERYCVACHGSKKPKASLDLSGDLKFEAIAADFRRWQRVLERIHAQEMPPETAPLQPTPAERAAAVAWLRAVRDREAERHAGDPGIVLARRLSNAEYDYTIRDLTGVDMRPAREFPVDPANEAGFDNTGESLAMSEALQIGRASCREEGRGWDRSVRGE